MKTRSIWYLLLLAITGLSASLVAVPVFAQTNNSGGQQDNAPHGFFQRMGDFFGGFFGHRGNGPASTTPNGAPHNNPSGFMNGQNGIFGTVTAVNGNTLTVTDNRTKTTYTVDASGATVTKDGKSSTVGAIAVNDAIIVQGTVSGTNVTATSIRDGALGRGPGGIQNGPGTRGILGTVTGINGATLTISNHVGRSDENTEQNKNASEDQSESASSGTTYTVDASGATVFKQGATTTVSSIQVGDTVMVQGTVSGTNITASTIRDGVPQGNRQNQTPPSPPIQGNGEPVVAGSVASISGNTLTVTNKGNVTYSIDASGATIVKQGATTTVASISTGDNVVVQGTFSGTSVTATSIIDQGQPPAQNGANASSTRADMGRGQGFFGAIGNFFAHLFGF